MAMSNKNIASLVGPFTPIPFLATLFSWSCQESGCDAVPMVRNPATSAHASIMTFCFFMIVLLVVWGLCRIADHDGDH